MLARNLIPSLLLLATLATADQALEARDVTTLVVEPIPGGPATAMTTFLSVITPSSMTYNATADMPTPTTILEEEPTASTTTLGGGWCWCPGPKTTPAAHVETWTIRAPTYTVTTVTLTPEATQTATVCRCPGEPSTTAAEAIPTTQTNLIPTTQTNNGTAQQTPAGNNILLNTNAGVKGTISKHLAAMAAVCGVGAGAGFLFL
ncbi:hypothetical protein FRB90_009750 [Tulasnella sp. 427]|nr:hypothetical protein FRB90_009750 [Tulasnella sp. 427]